MNICNTGLCLHTQGIVKVAPEKFFRFVLALTRRL
jgi:hypothetical protein